MSVYADMIGLVEKKGAGYVVLLDPDEANPGEMAAKASRISQYADLIFVGGSICVRYDFNEAVRSISQASSVPVVIFPGDVTQISSHADALLFLSLVSGRNANLLIGEHVKAAPILKRCGLEVIPVAYILIDGGRTTSVQFMSQTLAIPRDKPELAAAHALAGEYLGMKLVFLEAGSGADLSVPTEMVAAVNESVSIPIIVGGGIKRPEDAPRLVRAVASFTVTGEVIEKHGTPDMLREFADAIHWR